MAEARVLSSDTVIIANANASFLIIILCLLKGLVAKVSLLNLFGVQLLILLEMSFGFLAPQKSDLGKLFLPSIDHLPYYPSSAFSRYLSNLKLACSGFLLRGEFPWGFAF